MDSDIRRVQEKILEIMKIVDTICRENGIEYMIMGGTALGAVRHGGFIPWDDDLDIFMTPENYRRFRKVFDEKSPKGLVLQEWSVTEGYTEYAKVRMDGTTFIEDAFMDRKDMHHGIYIDIMILHKCPRNPFLQHMIYVASKFVVLVALSRRNWKPKRLYQKYALGLLKLMPVETLSRLAYRLIYRYETLEDGYDYCYFITKASFRQGIFARELLDKTVDVPFEDTLLKAPVGLKEYLSLRYGDYMKLPSEEEIESSVHARIYDVDRDYREYLDG